MVKGCFAEGLHVDVPNGLDSFLILDHNEEENVVVRAIGLYALYRVYNGLRHHQFRPEECRRIQTFHD